MTDTIRSGREHLMVGRNSDSFRPFIQAAMSGAGLLSGISVGAWTVFGTGLLDQWEEVWITPLGSIVVIVVSIAVLSALGWLGITVGLALTRKVAP
jgi:hypothetical protein